jgi:hypothetical protein
MDPKTEIANIPSTEGYNQYSVQERNFNPSDGTSERKRKILENNNGEKMKLDFNNFYDDNYSVQSICTEIYYWICENKSDSFGFIKKKSYEENNDNCIQYKFSEKKNAEYYSFYDFDNKSKLIKIKDITTKDEIKKYTIYVSSKLDGDEKNRVNKYLIRDNGGKKRRTNKKKAKKSRKNRRKTTKK